MLPDRNNSKQNMNLHRNKYFPLVFRQIYPQKKKKLSNSVYRSERYVLLNIYQYFYMMRSYWVCLRTAV